MEIMLTKILKELLYFTVYATIFNAGYLCANYVSFPSQIASIKKITFYNQVIILLSIALSTLATATYIYAINFYVPIETSSLTKYTFVMSALFIILFFQLFSRSMWIHDSSFNKLFLMYTAIITVVMIYIV